MRIMRSKLRIPKKGWIIIHLGLLTWAAWIAAGMVNSLIASAVLREPVSTVPLSVEPSAVSYQPEPDYSYIIRRNIFNSSQKPEEAVDYARERVSIPVAGDLSFDAPKTTLDVKLIGTVTDSEGRIRFAAIEIEKTKEQSLYKLNDIVLGARIVKIERNRALLLRDGKTEVLEVDFSKENARGAAGLLKPRVASSAPMADVSKISESEYAVSQRYLNAQLQNMNRLLTEARAIPNINKDGITDGFKVFSIKKGSIFDKIGFENHDVIKRINGIELDSAEKGLELFQALRNERNFEVDLVRRSQKKSLRFTVQ